MVGIDDTTASAEDEENWNLSERFGVNADENLEHSADEQTDDRWDQLSVQPMGEDQGIGILSASEGLKVAEESTDTTLRAYVTVDNRESIRIGTYLIGSYPDNEQLLARISALEYAHEFQSDDANEIHAKRAMRSSGIDEHDYKFIATLEPKAVVYQSEADDEYHRRMTDRVPAPETVIKQATDSNVIKTGLNIPEEGVFLGHLAASGEKVRTAGDPPTIDYRLKDDDSAGDPLLFRHTLIAGGTGSGKTHTSKNILRQYLDRTYEMDNGRIPQLAVVQFDPQDEYAQMHDDSEALDSRQYELQGIAYGGHEDTIALAPRVGSSRYAGENHQARQIEFTIPFSMVKENKWLMAGTDLNDNQYESLLFLLGKFFREGGKGATYAEYRSFIEDDGVRETLVEGGQVHEATYNALRRKTRGFGELFDQDATPITELVHELVRPGGLTVVPTYHLNRPRDKETVVLAVASLLIDQKLSNEPTYDRIKNTPLLIGMDEAHNFLTGANTVQASQVIGKFTAAAKQGRKERLGLFLITQDPQDIADAVFKQINTKIVLNLGDEDAIKSVNIPTKLEERVPYMEQGQMVVYSPDNSEPVEIIGLSDALTKHD